MEVNIKDILNDPKKLIISGVVFLIVTVVLLILANVSRIIPPILNALAFISGVLTGLLFLSALLKKKL